MWAVMCRLAQGRAQDKDQRQAKDKVGGVATTTIQSWFWRRKGRIALLVRLQAAHVKPPANFDHVARQLTKGERGVNALSAAALLPASLASLGI